jgi:hypothetical protein
MEKELDELTQFKVAFDRWMDLMRKMGLSDNIGEAIQELGLMVNIVKAMKDYVIFKEQQLEKKKKR